MANIKIGLDIGELKSKALEFQEALGQNGSAIEDFLVKGAKFNQAGKAIQATVQSLTTGGRLTEQTLSRNLDAPDKADRNWRLVSTSVKAASAEVENFSQKQAQAASKYATAGITGKLTADSVLAGAFDKTRVADSTTGRQAAFVGAQEKLAKTLSATGLEYAQAQEIFTRIKAGQADVEVGIRGQVQKALFDVVKAYQSIEKEADAAARKQQTALDKVATDAEKAAAKLAKVTGRTLLPQAEADIRKVFPVPSGATFQQIAKYEAAIQQVLKLIADGKLSEAQLGGLLARGKDIKSGIPGLSPDEAKARLALASIASAFDETGKAGEKAGKGILISWQGVIRLLETQIIRKIFRSIIDESIAAVQEFAKLSIEISRIQAVTQSAGLTTEQWSEKLRFLSDSFNVSLIDTTTAAYELLLTRTVSAAESTSFLARALEVSQVYGLKAKESIELLTSSMQVFGLQSSEINRVVAVLSRAVEDGNVNLNEFSQSLRRIGPTARAVGISFEEMVAAVSTLTIQGVKTSNAISLVQGVIEKLLHPSAEMVKLFREWGVVSGEDAIATFKFAGVLQRLQAEVQKGGLGKLGELEKDFRALGGVVGLSGDAFKGFEDQLNKVTDAQDRFQKSQEITRGTFGYQFEQAVKKIQNVFTVDIAQGFVTTVISWTKPLGGLANVIENLIGLIKLAIAGVVAYGVAIVTIRTVTLLWTASSIAAKAIYDAWPLTSANFVGGINAMIASTRAFIAANIATVAQLAITAVVLAAFWLKAAQDAREAQVGIDHLTGRERAAFDERLKEYQKQSDLEKEEFRKSYDEKYRIILSYFAAVRVEFNKQQDETLRRHDPVTEALGKNFEEVLKKYKRDAENLRHFIDEIGASIKSSQRLERGVRERADFENFERSLVSFSTPSTGKTSGIQQIRGVGNVKSLGQKQVSEALVGLTEREKLDKTLDKIHTLQEEAVGLFNKGIKTFDVDNIEEARKKLEEVDRLFKRIDTFQQAAQNIKGSQRQQRTLRDKFELENFNYGVRAYEAAGGTQLGATPATLQLAEKLKKDAAKLFEQGLKTFNTDNIEEARKKLEEVDKLYSSLLDKELSFRQKAAKLGVVFSTPATGPGSEIDSRRLANQKTRIDLESRYQESERKRASLLAPEVNRNTQLRIELETKFQAAQKLRAEQALKDEQRLLDTQKQLIKVEQARAATAEHDNAAKKAKDESNTNVEEGLKKQKNLIRDIEKFEESLTGSGFNKKFGHGLFQSDTFDEAYAKYARDLAKLKELEEEFDQKKNKKPEDVGHLQTQSEKVLEDLKEIERLQGKESLFSSAPYNFNGTTIKQLEEDLKKTLEKLDADLIAFDKASKGLEKARDPKKDAELGKLLDTIPDKYKKIGDAALKAAVDQKKATEDILKTTKEAIEQLKLLQKEFEEAKKRAPAELKLPPPVPKEPQKGVRANEDFQDAIVRLAAPVPQEPEPLRGDPFEALEGLQKLPNIPQRPAVPEPAAFNPLIRELLQPDFNPQIAALSPESRQLGEQSGSQNRTINFGDINVTLQGGGSTERQAREIAQMIRREVQRGNSLLS